MPIEAEKLNSKDDISEVVSFFNELNNFCSKKDIANALLKTLSTMLNAKFSSFVQREGDSLKVVSQVGEGSLIKNIFSKNMCYQIFDLVMKQKELTCLKLLSKEQFAFVPLIDSDKNQNIEHGILVFHMGDPEFEFNKSLNLKINVLSKLTSLSMSKFLKYDDSEKYIKLQEQIKSELNLTATIQRSICVNETSKKILFSVLEDEKTNFNGSLWWLSELDSEITLLLIAQVLCKGSPSAILSGYLIGEMNSLRTKAEISLRPQEVLKYLNQQLHSVFKSTGITVNAWYGVFNIGAKKVRFASANHPDPFLIGPEQQVTNLLLSSGSKGKSLGISLGSIFVENSSYISSGSKLIICTEDLLEQASKIGDKYDPSWLPQVLETIGGLPLSEMTNSLRSILSESVNGTAEKCSRLALLLEIPS